MSDYKSSLPIRTENNGDVVAKISDGVIPSRQLTVNSDGSLNITDAGGSITVDATDLDVRDLVFATDKVDASGSTVNLSTSSLAALESITVQNPGGVSAVNIQDGGNSITVDAIDLDIRDLSAVTDSVTARLRDGSGNLFSTANPLPVSLEESPGVEIVNYQTSAAVVKDASVNHDYTVAAAKTLLLSNVHVSASGKVKVQVLINGAVKFVAFNSVSNTNVEIPMYKIAKGAATQVIRITITNLDNQAQDVYSTVLGVEV